MLVCGSRRLAVGRWARALGPLVSMLSCILSSALQGRDEGFLLAGRGMFWKTSSGPGGEQSRAGPFPGTLGPVPACRGGPLGGVEPCGWASVTVAWKQDTTACLRHARQLPHGAAGPGPLGAPRPWVLVVGISRIRRAAAPQLPRGHPRHGAGSLWDVCQARAGGFLRWQSRGTERMWEGRLPSRQLLLGENPSRVCHRSFPFFRAERGVLRAPGGLVTPSPRPPSAGRGHQLRHLLGASPVLASPHGARRRGVGHVTGPPAASFTPSAAGSARPLLSHPGPPPSPAPRLCWTSRRAT